MRINLTTLGHFSHSMAACLDTGMTPSRALAVCGTHSRSSAFRSCLQAAGELCGQGWLISDGLEKGARLFPRFFIPLIRAGELSGRLAEAFHLLHDYCHRLQPSVLLIRNTWLYPLVCILFGWSIRTGIFVYFGMLSMAWQFVLDSFVKSLLLGLGIALLLKLRFIRYAVDRLLLVVPVVRDAEIHMARALFFETFSLVYKSGATSVLSMFDLALQTVRNGAVRLDFSKARRVLENHGTFGDAFNEPSLLDETEKGLIATGALSGTLDQSMERIVEMGRERLDQTLRVFNWFFLRIMAYAIAMSIVGTILMCLNYSGAR